MLDPRYRLLDAFRDASGRFQSRLDWRLDRIRRRLGLPDRVGGGGAGTRREGRPRRSPPGPAGG
jgi:hypothetical protein